jgi:hypothetical protein
LLIFGGCSAAAMPEGLTSAARKAAIRTRRGLDTLPSSQPERCAFYREWQVSAHGFRCAAKAFDEGHEIDTAAREAGGRVPPDPGPRRRSGVTFVKLRG